MLSDSIAQAIRDLLEQIEYYAREPFEYGCTYKEQFITALANLYFVLFSLDSCGDRTIVMDDCTAQSTKEIENIYSLSST